MDRFFIDAAQLNKYLPTLSESQKREIRNGGKIQVCEEQREGWVGKLPFYIFWCPRCDNFSYDYMHGFIDRQHMICHRCHEQIDFSPWWIELAQAWEVAKWMLRRDKGVRQDTKDEGGVK